MLSLGRLQGIVTLADGVELPFELANASGLERVRVAVAGNEQVLTDPLLLAEMPSERYEPLAVLGSGTMGRVVKARDVQLDRLVAIKLLRTDVVPDAEGRELFLSEGRSLARLKHPHLLGVYDLGVQGHTPFLVVEYIDGPDLDALRVTNGPFPWASVCAAGAHMGMALDALHQAGLVHRDVKPSNGLVDPDGRVVLADFGLVKPLMDLADPRSQIFGTPAYMSPEHLQGQALGPATDVYSLGATLHHLATGTLPFSGDKMLIDQVRKPAPDMRTVRADAPPELAELVLACLRKAPDARPLVSEVVDALTEIGRALPEEALGPYLPRASQGIGSSGSRPVVRRVTAGTAATLSGSGAWSVSSGAKAAVLAEVSSKSRSAGGSGAGVVGAGASGSASGSSLGTGAMGFAGPSHRWGWAAGLLMLLFVVVVLAVRGRPDAIDEALEDDAAPAVSAAVAPPTAQESGQRLPDEIAIPVVVGVLPADAAVGAGTVSAEAVTVSAVTVAVASEAAGLAPGGAQEPAPTDGSGAAADQRAAVVVPPPSRRAEDRSDAPEDTRDGAPPSAADAPASDPREAAADEREVRAAVEPAPSSGGEDPSDELGAPDSGVADEASPPELEPLRVLEPVAPVVPVVPAVSAPADEAGDDGSGSGPSSESEGRRRDRPPREVRPPVGF